MTTPTPPIEPPSESSEPIAASDERPPFCEAFWYVAGSRHACLKRRGHDGSCWCCEDYPGGNLEAFATLLTKGHTISG